MTKMEVKVTRCIIRLALISKNMMFTSKTLFLVASGEKSLATQIKSFVKMNTASNTSLIPFGLWIVKISTLLMMQLNWETRLEKLLTTSSSYL